jgi:predicted DNA-binding protein with PD1-like motif
MFALVFDKGDEVVAQLVAFAGDNHLVSGFLTGIGAFSDVTFGFFEKERQDYKRIVINEQVEVMSLKGNVALDGRGEPKLHAHVVVGKVDGTAHGGHLLEAHVWPTLEVILFAPHEPLRRSVDDETGLPLINLAEA